MSKARRLIEIVSLDPMERRDLIVKLEKENNRLKSIVLDLLAIEESYEITEEIGENFYEYIDKHREHLESYRSIQNK